MGILGGLDVGFGSNMQVVRTNYLCVKDGGAATTANAEKFLSLYNQHIMEQAAGNSGLLCDYILPMANQCSDAATTKSSSVIETINGSVMPVASQQANAVSNNGYGIISLLSVGAMEFTNVTLTAGVALASALDANAEIANGSLLVAMAGDTDGADGDVSAIADNLTSGMAKSLNLSGIVADLLAACGTGTVDLTNSALTNFVEKGNATGASHTPLFTVGANSCGVISVTTLCGAGYL